MPDAATKLAAHFQTQGRRIAGFGNPRDASQALARIMEREWGTTSCQRFQDPQGGGWIIDISAYVDGEALHGIIRTVENKRVLLTVVEADEVDDFTRTKKWTSPELVGPPPEEAPDSIPPASPTPPPPSPSMGPPAAVTPQHVPLPSTIPPQDLPDDPVLVVVLGRGDEKVLHHIRCTRAEVPDTIKMLLSDGYEGPVSEDQVEIWSRVSKPRVQVTF